VSLAAGSGGAASEVGISLRSASGREFVSGTTLAANVDVPPTTYTLRASPGKPGEQVTRSGTSIARVMQLASLTPDDVGFLAIPRPNGTISYLSRADIFEPPFAEGPALVSVDSSSIRYFRPVRGPDDVNADDNIATPNGQSLDLSVHTGNLLKVRASASPRKVTAGKPVSFSASADGGLPGERISFAWQFGDGASADGKSVSHTFKREGTYLARADATGNEDSGGSSPELAITVGNPPHHGGPGSGPPTGGSGNGPSGSGGGNSGGTGSPSNGGGTTTAGPPGAGGTSGSFPSPQVPSTTYGGGYPSTFPQTPSTPTTPSIPTTPQTTTPSTGQAPPAEASPSPTAGLTQVSGTLVASTGAAPPAGAEVGVGSGSPSEPSATSDSGSGSAPLPWIAIAVAALLAAGAAIELRGAMMSR
jgi:hypothetical protein